MKAILLVLGVLLFAALSYADTEYYYYSDNRQVPLYVDSSKLLILFDDENLQYESFLESYPRIDSLDDGYGQDLFKIAELNTGTNLDEFIDSLLFDGRVSLVNPYFINSRGSSIMVGRTICCKFGENVSYDFIDSLNAEYDVEIDDESEITPKQFLLSVMDNAEHSTLEISNIYYELNETEFSHPNFLGGNEWHSYYIYDHYGDEQWAMGRIFRAYSGSPDSLNHRVYEITDDRDSNIVVAIIDNGVGPHEDILENRLVAGRDFANMDYDPSPCDSADKKGFRLSEHGQSVAGILGASQNRVPDSINNPNTGIYGIAPSCKIMPIKTWNGHWRDVLAGDPRVEDIYNNYPSCRGYYQADEYGKAGAIAYAWTHDADIISMSWGFDDPIDIIKNEVELAAEEGRNGNGCALFASSGNEYGITYYPALYPEVISVTSLHPDDSIWGYCSNSSVDVCAPAGPYGTQDHFIWSDDLMGAAGYNTSDTDYACGSPNDVDYMCQFGGTSSAQPMAAGVAALILAVKPELTRQQLYDIIRNSADTDLYVPITNPPDQRYGYGMVHPMRALLAISRGDADNSHNIDLLDILYLIDYVYNSGPEPTPHPLMGDANGNGSLNLLDMLYLISYLYDNPPGPPPPISFEYGNYEF